MNTFSQPANSQGQRGARGGPGKAPGLRLPDTGALQRTQVTVERATPQEAAWISFLLIQDLGRASGKGRRRRPRRGRRRGPRGGGPGSHKGADKSTSAKRVRGPPLVWSPVSADTSGSRGAGRGPAEGRRRGAPGVPGAVIQPAGDHKGGVPAREMGGSLIILTDVHQHVPVGEGPRKRQGAVFLRNPLRSQNKQVYK